MKYIILMVCCQLLLSCSVAENLEDNRASNPPLTQEDLLKQVKDLEAENKLLKQELMQLKTSSVPQQKEHSQVARQLDGMMYRLQTMLETYTIDTNGLYPASLLELYQAASGSENGYFETIENVYTHQVWEKNNPSGKGVVAMFSSGSCSPGVILYQPKRNATSGQVNGYAIRGCGQRGELSSTVLKNP